MNGQRQSSFRQRRNSFKQYVRRNTISCSDLGTDQKSLLYAKNDEPNQIKLPKSPSLSNRSNSNVKFYSSENSETALNKTYYRYTNKSKNNRVDRETQTSFEDLKNYTKIISLKKYSKRERKSSWPWVVLSILFASFVFGCLFFWDKIPQASKGALFYVKNNYESPKESLNISISGLSKVQLPKNDGDSLYFVIHGYGEASSFLWVKDLSNALLEHDEGSAVILVDYWNLVELDGRRSCDNLKLVAEKIANILDILVEHYNLRLSQVHLIGYSLGGRVTGMVRHRIKSVGTIGRITALDPSHPWIEPYDESDYVEKGDADLVVTVKTSSISARTPAGHIDILFNGGYLQPGCDKWFYPILLQQLCSHQRAYQYLTEAVQLGMLKGCSETSGLNGNKICYEEKYKVLGAYLNRKNATILHTNTNSEMPFLGGMNSSPEN